jgi:hypothetical protein
VVEMKDAHLESLEQPGQRLRFERVFVHQGRAYHRHVASAESVARAKLTG